MNLNYIRPVGDDQILATKNDLGWGPTLFRDQSVFEIDFVPDELHHRGRQLRESAFHVRPALRGGWPMDAICKGLPDRARGIRCV